MNDPLGITESAIELVDQFPFIPEWNGIYEEDPAPSPKELEEIGMGEVLVTRCSLGIYGERTFAASQLPNAFFEARFRSDYRSDFNPWSVEWEGWDDFRV